MASELAQRIAEKMHGAWRVASRYPRGQLAAIIDAELADVREALADTVECNAVTLTLSVRAKAIHAPEDREILLLCERVGYGAVIDGAARQWFKKDPCGCHTSGNCYGTVQRNQNMCEAAFASLRRAKGDA